MKEKTNRHDRPSVIRVIRKPKTPPIKKPRGNSERPWFGIRRPNGQKPIQGPKTYSW
jgi:hypothetical protein